MKHIDFYRDMSAQDIKFYRKFANTYLMMIIMALIAISSISYAIYKDSSSTSFHILLGTLIANLIYCYSNWKMTLSEFKEAKERHGRMKEWDVKEWEKSTEALILSARVSDLERKASVIADENKILRSKLQEAEKSSYKCPEASLRPKDEANKPQWLGRKEKPDQTISA